MIEISISTTWISRNVGCNVNLFWVYVCIFFSSLDVHTYQWESDDYDSIREVFFSPQYIWVLRIIVNMIFFYDEHVNSTRKKKCVHVIFHLCIIARDVDNGIHGIGSVCSRWNCRKKSIYNRLRLTRSGFCFAFEK